MGKTYEALTEQQISWIAQQRVFYVASAAKRGPWEWLDLALKEEIPHK